MNRKQKRDAAKKNEARRKEEIKKQPEMSMFSKVLIIILIVGMLASFIILPIMAALS